MKRTKDNKMLIADGIDNSTPPNLVDGKHYYEMRCNTGHHLTHEYIGTASKTQDGKFYEIPICLICTANNLGGDHIYNRAVHLKEVPRPIPKADDYAKEKGVMLTPAQSKVLDVILNAPGIVKVKPKGLKNCILVDAGGNQIYDEFVGIKTWHKLIRKNLVISVPGGGYASLLD